jgi:hypothetical protein
VTEAPRDAATGRFLPAAPERSALARREYALVVQKHPNPSTLAPDERAAIAAFLGLQPSELEAAHAAAWQNPPQTSREFRPAPPQPVGPTTEELGKLSPVDRRTLQLGLRQR